MGTFLSSGSKGVSTEIEIMEADLSPTVCHATSPTAATCGDGAWDIAMLDDLPKYTYRRSHEYAGIYGGSAEWSFYNRVAGA